MDPELRSRITRPPLPDRDLGSLQLYTGRLSDKLDLSEARTASAVDALDACNVVNTDVQHALAPKAPWWKPWERAGE